MESLLESELYKKEPSELAQVQQRINILIRDCLRTWNTSRAEELEAEKKLVSKVRRSKERVTTGQEGEE